MKQPILKITEKQRQKELDELGEFITLRLLSPSKKPKTIKKLNAPVAAKPLDTTGWLF